jgi:hypothetical protein
MRQRKRMAERDQLGRLLGRHDAGDARGRKHIALLCRTGDDQIERFLREQR